MYSERKLSYKEMSLAISIHEYVPRSERLRVCQEICAVAEDLRERANEAVCESTFAGIGVREDVWKSLHFPRYRFFDIALPGEAWAQFAEDREVTT